MSKAVTKKKDDIPWYDKVKKPEELEVLKPWQTAALIHRFLFQDSWAKCARSAGKRDAKHLSQIAKSPAAKRLTDYLEKSIGDPVQMAKDIAAAASLNVTLDWYMALEWAKEAKNFEAVARMSKDLAALGGVQATAPKQEIETQKTIKIVFDGTDLDQEIVEADWEEVQDEDDEDS